MVVLRKEEAYSDFAEAFSLLRRQKVFLITFFVGFMILVVIGLLVWPKTYFSDSIVQLGSIGTNMQTSNIFEPVAAKSVMESTEVLSSATERYNQIMEDDKTVRKFKEDNLEVELVKEQVGRDERLSNYLKVRVKTNNPELSKELNEIILNDFLNYTTPYYNSDLKVHLQDKSQTEDLILQLKEDIAFAQKSISKASQSASDNLLLSRTIVDVRTQLVNSQNRLIMIESDLASKREFKVISEPELPVKPASPPVKTVFIIAIVIGILVTFAAAFLREIVKEN